MTDQLELKRFDFTGELKAAGDDFAEVEGYASIFGAVDQGGDVVAPGAFSASLARGEKVRMLWQHDPLQPIGVWDVAEEDAKGLRVKGRILTEVAKGREALALLRAGAMDGLSIGYRTVKATAAEGGVRRIEVADLWEVSVVTFPMLKTATVDAVKAADLSKEEFEWRLTQRAEFTLSEARALSALWFKSLAMQDAGDGLDSLAEALRRSAEAMKPLIGG